MDTDTIRGRLILISWAFIGIGFGLMFGIGAGLAAVGVAMTFIYKQF